MQKALFAIFLFFVACGADTNPNLGPDSCAGRNAGPVIDGCRACTISDSEQSCAGFNAPLVTYYDTQWELIWLDCPQYPNFYNAQDCSEDSPREILDCKYIARDTCHMIRIIGTNIF